MPAESNNDNTQLQSAVATAPLLLPSSDNEPKSKKSSESAITTQIAVDGTAVSLVDELGPMVVNTDGTLSRIANWPNMTVEERERTVRVLGKRNKLRLANVSEEQQKDVTSGDIRA